MNKYDILEEKLIAINAYIDTMHLENNATMEYLKQYKDYVNKKIHIQKLKFSPIECG